MKLAIKKFILASMVILGFAMASCEVCAKCTEPSTGYTDEYCGKKPDAEAYARTLRNQGWDCTVD